MGKPGRQGTSGTVGVTANHHILYLFQPRFKGFEHLGRTRFRSIRHTYHVGVAGLTQHDTIFLALGNDEPFHGILDNQQWIDAVDSVGRARFGGRVLTPAFAVEGVRAWRHWHLVGSCGGNGCLTGSCRLNRIFSGNEGGS